MKKLLMGLVGSMFVLAMACSPKTAEKAASTTTDKSMEKPVADNAMKSGSEAQMIIEEYITAVGGKDALMKVDDMSMTMVANTGMGQMTMKTLKKSGKYAMSVNAGGMLVQEMKYDGEKAKMGGIQGEQDITDEKQLQGMATQAKMFPETEYLNGGYNMEYAGKDKKKGKDVHILKVTYPNGNVITEFYDVATHLKVGVEAEQEVQGQTRTVKTTFDDYKAVEGIMIPHSVGVDGMGPFALNLEVTEIKINSGLSDELFEVN